MQKRVDLLLIENDNLKNKEKVLECELSNFDKAYYEREIGRLKAEWEASQIEAADHKFKLARLRQESQEKDKLLANKLDDIRQLQKNSEKDKMAVAEARAQYSQKERTLRVALEESEAANQVLCNSLEDLSRQLQREEAVSKEKVAVIDNLQTQIEVLAARGRDSEHKCMNLRKNYEEQLISHSKKLFESEENQKSTMKKSQAVIQRLSCDIEFLKTQQVSSTASRLDSRREGEEVEKDLRLARL
jgi:hypothetical protein